MSTFVTVGNARQSFARMLNAVDCIAGELPQPVVVQHGHTRFESRHCHAVPFIEMSDFERMVREADLVIMHAGGGGVMTAVMAGKIPVIMPRLSRYGEHVDDHQVENARALAASGRVVVAEAPEELGDAIARALARQAMKREKNAEPPLVELVRESLEAQARKLGE